MTVEITALEREYWKLHAKMLEYGLLDREDLKFCNHCMKILACPPRGESDEHWRWQVPNVHHKKGCHVCKIRDKEVYRKNRVEKYETIPGFVLYKWHRVKYRCQGPGSNRLHLAKERLEISKEDFLSWGIETLPQFLKDEELTRIYKHEDGSLVGIEVDRKENNLGYCLGNLQWILKKDHQQKSIKEGAWRNPNLPTRQQKTRPYGRALCFR